MRGPFKKPIIMRAASFAAGTKRDLPTDSPKSPIVGLAFAVAMTHRAARPSTQHLRFWSRRHKLHGTITDEQGGT